MPSPLRSMLATFLLAGVGCSGGTPAEPDLAGNAPLASVTQDAPTPSTSCTVTDNGGTFSAVAFWSGVTVWGLRFFDASSPPDVKSGTFTHPARSADGGFSGLTFRPTGVDLLGRTGETLVAAVPCL
jgi:hypothetical protein